MLSKNIITEITDEAGSPAYIYDGDQLERTANIVFNAFGGLNPHYSFKANPGVNIAKILLEAGFGAEVSSEFEARAALLAGFRPEDIMYDGPAKTEREIHHALSSGIYRFNVESRLEAERLAAVFKRTENAPAPSVCLRLNPERASSAGEVMTGEASRFGIDEEIFLREAGRVAESGTVIRGVHLYVGSQITDISDIAGNFKTGLAVLGQLAEKGLLEGGRQPEIVFGPGIGFSYETGEVPLKLPAAAAALEEISGAFRNRRGGLSVSLEIGRLLTAGCGIYTSKVVETKISRGRLYVLLDGGIHHFMRYALTGTRHRAAVIGKTAGPKRRAVIGGATCTPFDVLTETDIEQPAPGSIIAILDAGAYGWSMGMANFLSRATPPEIMVRGGKWEVIREAGTFENMLHPGPGA